MSQKIIWKHTVQVLYLAVHREYVDRKNLVHERAPSVQPSLWARLHLAAL
jgi:hypothetical protein